MICKGDDYLKYARKVLSGLTALLLFVSISMPTFATSISEYEYDSDLPLGIATGFHMFIHNDAAINAHCFGNIAVGNLTSANSTFGQALLKDAKGNGIRKNNMVNYVEKLSTNLCVTFYGDPFVFGKGAEIVLTDNGNKNKVVMNGFLTTEMPFKDCTMYVENGSKPFIDLDKEFDNLNDLSKEYVNAKNSSDVQTKFEMNSAEIKALAEGVNVKNLKFKDSIALCNNAILNVILDDTEKTTLIVNVDMAGAGNEVWVPVRTRFNGQGNKERYDSENSKILWNFYDSSKENQVYNGTLNFPNEWVGSVMAPGAKVNFYSNFDGTLIADSCSISGESHSWYYSGKNTDEKKTTMVTTKQTTTTTSKATTTSTSTTTSKVTTTSTSMTTSKVTTTPTTTTTSKVTTTPTTTTTSKVTTTPTTTTTSKVTTTPTTTTTSKVTTTPTTTTTSKVTTTPTTTTTSKVTTTPTTTTTSKVTTTPTTTTTSEVTTTTPTTTITSEVTTTTPTSTATSVVTTVTPTSTTTSQVTTTTPVSTVTTPVTTTSEVSTSTVATTTGVVTTTLPVTSNATTVTSKRTYATRVLARVVVKKSDRHSSEVDSDDTPTNKQVLALTVDKTADMPDTGTEDGKALPIVLGGLFLVMGIYGFVNRRKLLSNSEDE